MSSTLTTAAHRAFAARLWTDRADWFYGRHQALEIRAPWIKNSKSKQAAEKEIARLRRSEQYAINATIRHKKAVAAAELEPGPSAREVAAEQRAAKQMLENWMRAQEALDVFMWMPPCEHIFTDNLDCDGSDLGMERWLQMSGRDQEWMIKPEIQRTVEDWWWLVRSGQEKVVVNWTHNELPTLGHLEEIEVGEVVPSKHSCEHGCICDGNIYSF